MLNYTFNENDFRTANALWGCNCGPAALAFALQTTLDAVRPAIPQFEERHYTSPMMMAAALQYFAKPFKTVPNPSGSGGRERDRGISAMFAGPLSLVRIQWSGPWTAPKASVKWAATHTHWIVAWAEAGDNWVFDGNCGMVRFAEWQTQTAPAITASIPRADGGWFPADVWRLK
jgi:hypothetical protein